LIEAVFADLERAGRTESLDKLFRLSDGASFIHIVIEHDVAWPIRCNICQH
jgi:hypothetical protein